jgi:hypothetical protein
MNNHWVIGTFFTEDTPYQQVYMDYLLKSLDRDTAKDPRLATKTLMTEIIPNQGSWHANVAQKPAIILKQLQELPENSCLCFVDADATFEQYPIMFDETHVGYDLAVHLLDWNAWYGYNENPPRRELLSGTIFIRNNAKTRRLCQVWHEEALRSNEWEQAVLARVLPQSGVVWFDLPLSYCYIKTRPGGLPPLVQCDPVILHHQASRTLKRTV